MDVFSKTPQFDFLTHRVAFAGVSVAVILVCIATFAIRGLSYGIDFTGGVLVEVGYDRPAEISRVRTTLEQAGYHGAVVQHFGTAQDVLVRLAPREGVSQAQLSDELLETLERASDAAIDLRRVEFVGPQVGEELREQGGLAMLIALGAILLYVAFRFEYRFAVGSVVALAHDVLITVGFFAVTGMEFDLTVLAALLAVIGYSLNDTIVVFDRIRENFRRMRKGTPVEIVNVSINQTLSRTIMTGLTTLLVLVALLALGGELIQGFSVALIVGIVVGTYSSIYIASAVALALGISKSDLLPVKKEGVEADPSP